MNSKYGAQYASVAKSGNVCLLMGRIKNGTSKKIGKLPQEFAPKAKMNFNVVTDKKPVGLEIHEDGSIQVAASNDIPKWLSLDGAVYPI